MADNLVIVGLPSINYANAASADGNDLTSSVESTIVTEKAVLDFCQKKLNILIAT